MGINKFQAVLLTVLLYTINVAATCTKKLDCRGTVHQFEAHIKIYPDNAILHIGDTVWVSLDEPTTFTDVKTGQVIGYSGAANFGTSINYDELLGDHKIAFCAECFDYILAKGEFLPDALSKNRNRDYRFLEQNGRYVLLLGVIPKKTGTFSLGISNAINIYQKVDNCSKSSFEITFKETNQHLDLYKQNRPGYEPSEYEQTHMYCFKVE